MGKAMNDVRTRIAQLIEVADEDTVVVAGQRLSAPGEARPGAARLREELGRRFVERRPHATEHTWQHFVAQLREFVKTADSLSDDLLQGLYVLIDGL